MPRRLRSQSAAFLGVATVGLLVASCSSSSGPSGSALVRQVDGAASRAASVSYKIIATQSPTASNRHPAVETLVAQVSAPVAAESIRFSTGEGNLDVILIDGVIYIRADAATLASALGVPDQAASTYAGKWISIQPTDEPYDTIASTLTLDANVSAFLPTGTNVTVGQQRTLAGATVLPLTGPAPTNSAIKSGVVRLYVSPTTRLPVAAGVVGTSPTGARNSEVVRFVSWGKPVQATAPTGAVPFTTVIGH